MPSANVKATAKTRSSAKSGEWLTDQVAAFLVRLSFVGASGFTLTNDGPILNQADKLGSRLRMQPNGVPVQIVSDFEDGQGCRRHKQALFSQRHISPPMPGLCPTTRTLVSSSSHSCPIAMANVSAEALSLSRTISGDQRECPHDRRFHEFWRQTTR